MKRKSTLIFLCVAATLAAFYVVARSRVNTIRSDYTYKLHAIALPLPEKAVMALAGEFKGLAADYLLLEAVSFIGSRQAFHASPEDWEAVARLLDQSSLLDPYFRQTYLIAQATLPWRAQKVEEALTILERSKKHLPWDWIPGFFIGFDYFFFFKDNLTAAEKLMEASKIDNAPISVATLGSRLASEAGQTRAAIEFLTAVYEKSDDEFAKEVLKKRIEALEGVSTLETAIARFKAQNHRNPHSLDELVDQSILPVLPANPYNRSYSLKHGKVDF